MKKLKSNSKTSLRSTPSSVSTTSNDSKNNNNNNNNNNNIHNNHDNIPSNHTGNTLTRNKDKHKDKTINEDEKTSNYFDISKELEKAEFVQQKWQQERLRQNVGLMLRYAIPFIKNLFIYLQYLSFESDFSRNCLFLCKD